ncbi:MAG: M56 family metallopeptidase [Pirellulaceae bacterium]|nr:M56 family metallopeptidase [Pirellulaceae bacterium]
MMTPYELLASFSAMLGITVLQSLIPITLIWAAVQACLLVIPQRMPSVRYATMMLGLVLLTIPPVAILSRQSWFRAPAPGAELVEGRLSSLTQRETNSVVLELQPTSANQRVHWVEQTKKTFLQFQPKREHVGYFWLLGLVITSSRIAISAKSLRRWSRNATRCDNRLDQLVKRVLADMGCRKPVALLICKEKLVPMACGFLKPVIIIPASLMTSLTPRELEAILKHEVAHLIRNDLWHNAFQLLIESLLFYHPCVWLLSRQIRRQREICCDALAAPSHSERLHLGNALLKLELLYVKRSLLSAAATEGDTMMRIRFLCNKTQATASASSLATVGLVAVTAFACLSLVNLPNKQVAIAEQPVTLPQPESPLTLGTMVPSYGETRPADAQVEEGKTVEEKQAVKNTANQNAHADTATSYELVGKVVDKSGKPLANASVFWADFLGDQISTSSAPDGQFRILLPKQDEDGFHFLWVVLPGYNTKAVQPLLGSKLVPDCVVVLEASQETEIQVLDADGLPCSGAQVTPYYHEVPNGVFDSDQSTGLGGRVPPGVAKLLNVTTDASGKAVLRGLKKDFLSSVNVKSGDMAVQTHRQGKIRLAPVANVRGKIDAADLRPLAGGKLKVSTKSQNFNANADDPFENGNGVTSLVECEVAEDGSFEARNVVAGVVSFHFRWDPNSPKQLRMPEPQSVRPNEELFVSLKVVDAVKVQGKLVKEDSLEPVADCRVSMNFGVRTERGLRQEHSVISDELGQFEAYVIPGEVEIDPEPSPSVWEKLRYYDFPYARITVSPHDPARELPPMNFLKQIELKVLVVDENNSPLAKHRILRLNERSFQSVDAGGLTDEMGYATVHFRRNDPHPDFTGDWVLAKEKIDRFEWILQSRKLPRLRLKQSSPPIFELVAQKAGSKPRATQSNE